MRREARCASFVEGFVAILLVGGRVDLHAACAMRLNFPILPPPASDLS